MHQVRKTDLGNWFSNKKYVIVREDNENWDINSFLAKVNQRLAQMYLLHKKQSPGQLPRTLFFGTGTVIGLQKSISCCHKRSVPVLLPS